MASSNSPCAACKFLRRKCIQECVFAPYFPADQPQRFANVHKVFGASNVAKLLNELPPEQREDAVNSLAFEAEARLRDPVYGCVGMISFLQQRLKHIQAEVYSAKKELATYIGPSALLPMIQSAFVNQAASASGAVNMMQPQQYNMGPLMAIPTGIAAGPSLAGPSHAPGDGTGGPQLVIREPQQQQQQFLEAQQLAALAVRDDQEIFQNWEQPQHQQFMRFHGGNGGGYEGAMVVDGGGEFNEVGSTSAATLPSLALGATPSDQTGYDHQIQAQQQQQQQQDESLGQLLFLQQPATPQQQQQGHGEIDQDIPHHHEHNNQQQQQQQQQQQGSTSQSHNENLVLELHHQHEHVQHPQLQLQPQPQGGEIE